MCSALANFPNLRLKEPLCHLWSRNLVLILCGRTEFSPSPVLTWSSIFLNNFINFFFYKKMEPLFSHKLPEPHTQSLVLPFVKILNRGKRKIKVHAAKIWTINATGVLMVNLLDTFISKLWYLKLSYCIRAISCSLCLLDHEVPRCLVK